MKKSIGILVFAAAAASLCTAALARGSGGTGGGGFSHGSAGGPAASNGASANSNGRFAEDRDKGLDRAEDRRSAQGASHEKATDPDRHKKSKRAKRPETPNRE